MKTRLVGRWKTWLWASLLAAACALVFAAWLAPQNVASWPVLSSFCT